MGWYTVPRRGLQTCVWLYSLLFVIKIQTVYTDDGTLEVPTLPWYFAMRIDLKCTINPTACKGAGDSPDQTVFKKDGSIYCSVAANAICLTKPPDDIVTPGKCWCVTDAQTSITTYVYRFSADPALHNGDWTCSKNCYVNNALFPTTLTINNAAGVNKIVQAKPTPDVACAAGIQTAVLEPERSKAVCYLGNSSVSGEFGVGDVIGSVLGTFGGCCGCAIVIGVILAVMFKLYRETKILFDPHGKQLTEEVIQKIMKHIVEHFKTKHIQGSTHISFVFGKDKKDPNTVTIFGKEKELFNAVVCEIQEIINKYNPGAHPRKLNAGGPDDSHELGIRNKDNSKPN